MAQKMILVDPNSMMLKTTNVPDVVENNIMKIDLDMKKILELSNVSEHEKAIMYEQTLRKYLLAIDQKVNQVGQSPPISFQGEVKQPDVSDVAVIKKEKKEKLENRMVNTFPKTLREKGQLLLDHLKDTSNLDWNEFGEIELNGKQVPGSNISDLINDTLRPRKTGIVPRGWDMFAGELKRTNVPMDLIGNKKRYNQTLDGHMLEFSLPPSSKISRKVISPPSKIPRRKSIPSSSSSSQTKISWQSWP